MDPLITVAHTVVTIAEDGSHHVQHFGPEHIVEESINTIELKPGERIMIRHVK